MKALLQVVGFILFALGIAVGAISQMDAGKVLIGLNLTLAATLVSGVRARLRIWASDGIHTASDESDGPFTVPNRAPSVRIIRPEDDTTIASGQSLALEAEAYDVDAGVMPDEQIRWSSDRDGVLGQGAQLTIMGLSPGEHVITVRADDGQGGVATDSVRITVFDTPQPPRQLYFPLAYR